MELLLDPQAWVAFVTLAALEIVLGIDNIIFVAILADRVKEDQRARARRVGLSIAITTRATRLPTGVFPLRARDRALEVIRAAYPAAEDAGDGLSGALMNAGPIIHPPLIVMNAGPIEHFEHWDIHNEGTQPAIRRVTDALDAERMATREALGYGPPHCPLGDH